jgi:GT2 family glycosyltransferase
MSNSNLQGKLTAPVMILNWNGWEDTFRCLRSIREVSDVSEVWLVDNGSDSDRRQEAASTFPGLRVIRWETNYGWAGGYNQALQLAAAEGQEYAYLLNNDCTVTPGFLSTALNAACSDASLAAVGSIISFADPCGDVRFDGSYHEPGEKKLIAFAGCKPVPEVNGAGMLVRLKALEQDGYFDERFFCYFEETEWCLRMKRKGWHIGIVAESNVHHSGRRSNTDANFVYYRLRNNLLLRKLSSTHDSWYERVRFGYLCLRVANRSRRAGDMPTSLAATQAFRDGIHERFGKRSPSEPDLMFQAFSRSWPLSDGAGRVMIHRSRAVRRALSSLVSKSPRP